MSAATLRKLAKVPSKTRKADEFKGASARTATPPRSRDGIFAWSLETIRRARDCQQQGKFASAVRLATALRTDDAILTARSNRLAPQSAVQTKLEPARGARGEAVARRAASSVKIARTVLKGIHGTLVDHGIAIGYIDHEANDEGTRVDFSLREWPLEHVEWDESRGVLTTSTREGERQDIIHGDGRWVVFREFYYKPWNQEAALLAAALIWPAHANALADMASATRAHGLARVLGELPEGVSLNGENGELTEEAQSYITLLADLVNGDAAAGIRPAGSKTEFLSNGSSAWQVFTEMIGGREKAAARIYLGTDAMLGSVGGAPGVDIATLFGVATTKIQGDFEAIESALNSGVYVPWTAINEGDSLYAPSLKYQLPDPDADKKSEQRAAARTRLSATLKEMRDAKMLITQEVIDTLASEFGVSPAPALAPIDAQTSTLVLAPTSLDVVVKVSEARASQGLPPFGDARDDMTLDQLKQLNATNSEIAVDNAAAEPAPQ